MTFSRPHNAIPPDEPAVSDSLGLDDFVEPDDQGLSLNELSQAYAALLSKGTDPYQETGAFEADEIRDQPTVHVPAADEPPAPFATEDDDSCPVCPRTILEAILFVGHPTGEPLASERIAGLMRGVRPAEIDDLVRDLNAEYDAAGAPYKVCSVGAGYQLALRPEFGPLRDTFHGRIREARLSPSAIDVLAIVAYQQPILADEIDRLRTKPSGAILGQLVRRDLLRLERPAEKGAKPTYRTTSRFLDLFGLDDIAELPRSHDLEREL
jgi:segregation and condensation protein B